VTAIRTARAAEGKFVQISNAAAQDPRLSLQARGVILFVLSLPPDREFTAKWLESQVPNGRESIRSALAELRACGYMRRTRRQDEHGHWHWEQVISDALIADDGAGEPTDGMPSVGQPQAGPPSDKTPNTAETKDAGPVDLASRRARAKAASEQLTIQDALNAVHAAVAEVHGQQEADDLTKEERLGLFFTYVGARRPAHLVPYLAKIFCDAPYMDTFLANSSPACLQCQKWDADCECPAA
jgi:hypothetical protein